MPKECKRTALLHSGPQTQLDQLQTPSMSLNSFINLEPQFLHVLTDKKSKLHSSNNKKEIFNVSNNTLKKLSFQPRNIRVNVSLPPLAFQRARIHLNLDVSTVILSFCPLRYLKIWRLSKEVLRMPLPHQRHLLSQNH